MAFSVDCSAFFAGRAVSTQAGIRRAVKRIESLRVCGSPCDCFRQCRRKPGSLTDMEEIIMEAIAICGSTRKPVSYASATRSSICLVLPGFLCSFADYSCQFHLILGVKNSTI